jgi:hypothetical protein
MVNANHQKELQNVLPKGNPFHGQIEYTIYEEIAFAPLALLLWAISE